MDDVSKLFEDIKFLNMFFHVKIQWSRGRGKNGRQYGYIRPAKKCFNKSRRCTCKSVTAIMKKHFPVVNYYEIDGFVIGAKNKDFALKEYWRVCEKSKIKQQFEVKLIIDDYPPIVKLESKK